MKKNKLRFYIGNFVRFINSTVCGTTVKIEEVRTIFGVSFKKGGYHHIVQTLGEYDLNSDISYKDTAMYAFLKYFSPNSICDLVNIGKLECKLPIFIYPWGGAGTQKTLLNKNVLQSRFLGPSSDEFIKDEFEKTIALYHKIKQEGYKSLLYGGGYIEGMLLMNKTGEKSFIVLQGNHRTAILSHMGINCIKVRKSIVAKKTIKEKKILKWKYVKKDTLSKHTALCIFNLFFTRGCGVNVSKVFVENKR